MNTIFVKSPKKGALPLQNFSTAEELAKQLHLTEPAQALAARINGTIVDLSTPLKPGDEVEFIDFDDPLGKEVFWHTSAHLLAQAVLRLFPSALPTIGPPIENGFYYDFANLILSDEDFPKIEAEMEAIVKENFKSQRELIAGKKDALRLFGTNKYKKEIIEGFEDETITGYRQGEFFDLCRGPHLPFLGKIKALKILKTSGAYWRGDSSKEMLTRIYGITFPDRKLLKEYLHQLEEAKKRDHKVIGPRLGLFSLQEEAPGMPFIHPEGMIIWNALLDYWRQCHQKAGYQEIKTPQMMKKELWEISGHWQNYRQNMYTSTIEDREFAIKPMNCPGCILFYKTAIHSYKKLPMRVAEIGHVHRHEASGALSGLMRVRCFHQDDAHIFCLPDQIMGEILEVLRLVDEIYSTFGLKYHIELSTRPENSIGSDEAWEITTEALRQALNLSKRDYKVNEGDGAFYGPKLDIHIRDAIGRTWQCGTIQLDMSLPERFGLAYDDAEGTQKRPIMIHRVIFGSVERFFGILIEHFAGRFPLWMSPRQVDLIPVADRHVPYAQSIQERLKEKGYHVSLNDSPGSVNKKIREAQLNQVNYMLTIGDKEMEHKTISIRTREGLQVNDLSLEEFLSRIEKERISKALDSPFKEGYPRQLLSN